METLPSERVRKVAELSISLDADPAEAIWLLSEDLGLLKEVGVDAVVFYAGDQLLGRVGGPRHRETTLVVSMG